MTTPDPMAAILLQLAEQAEQIATLQARLDALADVEEEDEDERRGYRPLPAARWWLRGSPALSPDDREALAQRLDRLRDWVNGIYRPMYGHLAEQLPHCWERHPHCLMTLDWLSEFWQVLYLQPGRSSLPAQGDFATRLLPQAAEQMAREAEGCGHPRRVVSAA